jgi:hydrogenase maturation protease
MGQGEMSSGGAIMTVTRIIGIGSPSGDDQAGWLVVQALENRLPPDIRIEQLDRPGSALIPLLEKADRAILVDAMQGSSQPGNIRHFGNDEWAAYRQGLSTHGLGVFDALMMARELGCLPRDIELYGIEIGSVLSGSEPSEIVMRAAQQLADRIADEWAADIKKRR